MKKIKKIKTKNELFKTEHVLWSRFLDSNYTGGLLKINKVGGGYELIFINKIYIQMEFLTDEQICINESDIVIRTPDGFGKKVFMDRYVERLPYSLNNVEKLALMDIDNDELMELGDDLKTILIIRIKDKDNEIGPIEFSDKEIELGETCEEMKAIMEIRRNSELKNYNEKWYKVNGELIKLMDKGDTIRAALITGDDVYRKTFNRYEIKFDGDVITFKDGFKYAIQSTDFDFLPSSYEDDVMEELAVDQIYEDEINWVRENIDKLDKAVINID